MGCTPWRKFCRLAAGTWVLMVLCWWVRGQLPPLPTCRGAQPGPLPQACPGVGVGWEYSENFPFNGVLVAIRAALLEPSAHGFLNVYLMFRAECPLSLFRAHQLIPRPDASSSLPEDPEWSPLSGCTVAPKPWLLAPLVACQPPGWPCSPLGGEGTSPPYWPLSMCVLGRGQRTERLREVYLVLVLRLREVKPASGVRSQPAPGRAPPILRSTTSGSPSRLVQAGKRQPRLLAYSWCPLSGKQWPGWGQGAWVPPHWEQDVGSGQRVCTPFLSSAWIPGPLSLGSASWLRGSPLCPSAR